MAANKHQGDQNAGISDPRMTSSITSLLASPVDSGVALLDSDGDCTSVSEVTINETDSLSLQDDREADIPYSEIEDNRINHQLVTLGTCEFDQPKMLSVKKSGSKSCSEEGVTCYHKYLGDCVDSEPPHVELNEEENTSISQFFAPETSFPSIMTESDILSERVDNVLDRMTQSCMSCIDLKHENDSKNYALSTGSCDNIVFRKQRRKKRNGSDGRVKRVSFHEDIIRLHDSNSASDMVSSKSVDTRNVSKDRYSWCGEGVATQQTLQEIKPNVRLSSPELRSCFENNKCNEQNLDRNNRLLGSLIITVENDSKVLPGDQKELLCDERGTPEGQEDPPNKSKPVDSNIDDNRYVSQCSYLNLKTYPSFASSMDESDLESMLSEADHKQLSENFLTSSLVSSSFTGSQPELPNIRPRLADTAFAYKRSILNRFMKSVAEKNSSKRKSSTSKSSGLLYIKGLRQHVGLVKHQKEEIEDILKVGKAQLRLCGVQICALHLEGTLQNYVFIHEKEMLYKVYKVRGSYFLDESNDPLLVVLSDKCLYLVGMKNQCSSYNHRVIPYQYLDVIIVGPNYQTLLFSSLEQGIQVMMATACSEITSQLMCHLEIAVRRSASRQLLPAVRELQLDDMKSLLHWLRQDLPLDDEEKLYHYSLVHLQDKHLSPPSTPLGPIREGHLMFRPATVSPLQAWEPGYFILKGGVVYMFGDKDVGLPKRVIPLTGGHCLGCRRISADPRPHTFEIIIGHSKSFQFAAADEYEASEWLQAFVQSASGVYECERVETIPCSLLLTSQYVLACREPFPCGPVHILSCAAVKDIVAFGIVSDDQSWCILEFVCREVHESSGDWIVYFTSSAEMQSFRSSLQQVWLLEDMGNLPVDDGVDPCFADRCWSTSKMLTEAWDSMLQPV